MHQYIKNSIVRHLNTCSNRIIEEETVGTKCYYLGIASDVISSSIFFEPDEKLKFIEFILNVIYNTFSRYIEEGNIRINENVLNNIADNIRVLSERIMKEDEVHDILENMVSIAFNTTTTGQYLSEISSPI